MKKETKVVLSAVILIILITISFFHFTAYRNGITYLTNSINLNSNWECTTSISNKKNIISIPKSIKNLKQNEIVTITNTLPDSRFKSPGLLIKTELQNINVYLDDELIFKNDKNKEQLWGKSPESSWCFVPLPNNYAGRTVNITYTSEYTDFIGKINGIVMCEKDFENAYILYSNLPKLIISFVILAMGIVLSSLYFGLKKAKDNHVNILYLGLLDIMFFIWVVLDNKFLDILIDGYFPSAEFKIISMYLLFILFNIFLKESFYREYSKMFNTIVAIYVILLGITTSMHVSGIAHYVETLKYVHLFIVANFMIIIYILIKKFHNTKDNIKVTAVMSLVFIIPVAIFLYAYYTMNINSLIPVLEITVLVFSIIFSIIIGRRFVKYYNKQIESQVYKRMAYTDSLTNAPNRAAYINKIDLLNKLHDLNYDPYLFLFDLNNLKGVNDKLGHKEGDLYITNCVDILNSIFLDYGTVFRIGGDEFAFINDTRLPLDKCLQKLADCNFKISNMFTGIATGIAYGYSKININAQEFESAYTIADSNMYKCKRQMKQN